MTASTDTPLAHAHPRVVAPAHATGASTATQVVALDMSRLERAGHVIPTRGRSLLGEEFRRIKHHLLSRIRHAQSPEERMTLIGVTSALPGEGKTTTAINLALSMSAEIDTTVLLVDADVLRPDVLHRLGVAPRPGLLDLLESPGMDPRDVLLKTNVPKLTVLPAGRARENAAELLSSEAMDDLLDTLVAQSPRQVIVFDAPPLLLSTESRALAHRMGQIVVVVEAGKTPRSAVTQAFAAIDDCPHVLALLNKASEASHFGYDDYYG